MTDLTPYKECPAHKQWIFIANASQIYTEKVYRPCCWFKTNIEAKTPSDFYAQLAGCDIETNCGVCIDMEKTGSWSPRTLFKDSVHSDKLLVVTASFDNLCNLKCITCSPENSTQIATERIQSEGNNDIRWFNKLKNQAPGKIDFIKQLLEESDFEEFRFEVLGGEPLINPMVLDFIDWLAEQPYAKKTTLNITTNGTTKSPNIQKYIDNFFHFSIQMSVDGIEDTFEYIRSGADYEVLKDTVNYYYDIYNARTNDNLYNFSLSFNYTLSWMNSMNFGKFINWISVNYPKVPFLLVTKLLGPDQYCIDVLSTKQKQLLYEKSISYIDMNIVNKGIVEGVNIYKQHMLAGEETTFNLDKFNDALNMMSALDSIRDTSYKNAFNETIDFIHNNI